jgi:uncharacterized protein (TIGR03000 family)
VPADAVIEVDGVKTSTTGSVRQFITPALTPGLKYVYQVKVTVTKTGSKPVTVEEKITVEAGKATELDLSKSAAFANEEAKAEEAKKDESKKAEPVKEAATEPKTAVRKDVPLDVPYVPTPEPVVDAMLKLAGVTDKDVVYDLGCGDGRIVITAVKKFKAKKGLGIELAPERVKLSKENAVKEGVEKMVEIREGSVLDLKDVSEASVVTLYLLPKINLELMPVLQKTLKPGSRIVSHDFDMGDWKADKEITVEDETGRKHTVYLWTIAEKK